MRLTTKGRYATAAMLDMALHKAEQPTNLAAISARQNIPLAYLEQLFVKLRKHGLVESVRGPGGGYCLLVDSDDITPAQILYAVNESADLTSCGGQQNCMGTMRCLTHDLWMGLNHHMAEYLNGISLGELCRTNNVRRVAERQDTNLLDSNSNINMSS